MLTAEQEQEVEQMKQEVDITLIRWMLSLSPLERLRIGQQYAASAWRLQNAAKAVRVRSDFEHSAEA